MALAAAPLFLLAALPLTAAEPAAAATTSFNLAPGSRLWLAGDSTLHPYTITATKVEVAAGIDAAAAEGPAAVRAAVARGGLRSLRLSVAVADLKSGESGLDKNMRKALKQDQAPVIRFTLADYQTESAKDDGLVVKVRGRLAIGGVEKDAVVTGECRFGPDGLEVTGTDDILMSDFGVKPPTLMFGAIKTADKVAVHFTLKLKASNTTTAEK